MPRRYEDWRAVLKGYGTRPTLNGEEVAFVTVALTHPSQHQRRLVDVEISLDEAEGFILEFRAAVAEALRRTGEDSIPGVDQYAEALTEIVDRKEG